jgi:hypothetical protein
MCLIEVGREAAYSFSFIGCTDDGIAGANLMNLASVQVG